LILTISPNFGVRSSVFGFNVSWATNHAVVVEACADMAHCEWQPLQTNALTETPDQGWFYFSDRQWLNYPKRFYRVRTP